MLQRPLGSFVLALACLAAPLAEAAPPWNKLGSVQESRRRSRTVSIQSTENNGPWMVMARHCLRGPAPQDQARDLVQELRAKYKLPAYTYQKKVRALQGHEGRGVDRYGAPL